jgi:hypothetical protein
MFKGDGKILARTGAARKRHRQRARPDAQQGCSGSQAVNRDLAAARDQYAALLPVRERVLGPEHPDSLQARHELAHWTGQAGDPAAARDQYAALLPVRQRVSGPEHPDTVPTISYFPRGAITLFRTWSWC